MIFSSVFEEFGRAFVPKKLTTKIKSLYFKAGYNEVAYDFIGFIFFISVAFTITLYWAFVLPILNEIKFTSGNAFASSIKTFIFSFGPFALFLLGFFLIFGLVYYFYLDFKIFNRTKKMESVLADYLRIVSINLRGGMSFEQSLWSAIDPQFSHLADEISLASKKVATGYDLDDALREFSEKYDSPIIKRNFDLIIGEIKTGGKIADIIDKVIEDLKDIKVLKEDMEASVISYMIFIGAIVIVISPMLFALSYNLLIIVGSFIGKLAASTSNSSIIPISISGKGMNYEGFKMFSYAAMALISICSSMILSILQKGNIKSGVKFIPIFVVGSIIVYSFAMWVLGGIFGGLV